MKNGLIFTIFGGTGNLTYNKIFPALYQLFQEGKLQDNILFVAIGRRYKTSDQYIYEIEQKIKEKISTYTKESYSAFKEKIFYYKMDFNNEAEYTHFNYYMELLDKDRNIKGNRIYYLATSPGDFPIISENLKKYCLLHTKGFKRAVFEKPFGYDLESAKEINRRITEVFGEENIYRIDHYLGKEMIQNILTIRFSNQIFKSVWNKDSIDNVQITVKENNGVEERGGYYDQSGALRDMIQNHLLQILTLVAMEKPKAFDTDSIRDEKVKVLKKIKINSDKIVFGQYKGYLQEDKVNPNSKTETYVALKCEIDNPRWEGVPFFLRTGKYLDSKEAEIIIEFKNDENMDYINSIKPNLLIIKIQPEEGIYFRINSRKPRSEREIMSVSMDYCQSCNIVYRSPEAYEKLLYDIINGDSTLFTRWDEVDNAWKIIKELIEVCKKDNCLFIYEKGTEGPIEAKYLIEETNRKWWNIDELNNSKFDF